MKFLKLGLFLLPLLYVGFLLSPVSFSAEEVRLVVYLDEDQNSVLSRLKEEKIIKNQSVLRVLITFMKFPAKVNPGAYKLKRNMWLPQIAYIILYRPYQKWITIVPGYRKEQVLEALLKIYKWNDASQKEFMQKSEEGYLFPDTYLLNVDFTPEAVLAKFSNNFNEKFDSQLQNDLLAQDVRNDTAVKIASLIERESGGESDKALIAGIIWNRLNKGMKLQIDAATQYILGKPGNWWPKVTPSDHKIDSPYNTYINKGLPPGPISNPSLASIKAVIYPAETDCLFYIHDRNKQIHCSLTYEEHLENIEKFLK
ncbi:hypothetical protein A3D78_06955 [Candidatus Gottesmanbacteria bacterium RIFCSPHIGHO2_02_FULL_39_14]|uniref:Endolytic murein transglycosylase n=1 Tax=Candidatus Gottesmanbacteria bacterium RIFCSPHIGHO2_02_FULL_39_14 TaxID=1798383 RepID=A0A1F5ZU37_9BACT|nr:MAG: hypothetical protein A3D78_06955 [Candidatus Gottesmanbacteria bacterium RIFCSPHIGHO2_02_FULL_39_14]